MDCDATCWRSHVKPCQSSGARPGPKAGLARVPSYSEGDCPGEESGTFPLQGGTSKNKASKQQQQQSDLFFLRKGE